MNASDAVQDQVENESKPMTQEDLKAKVEAIMPNLEGMYTQDVLKLFAFMLANFAAGEANDVEELQVIVSGMATMLVNDFATGAKALYEGYYAGVPEGAIIQ